MREIAQRVVQVGLGTPAALGSGIMCVSEVMEIRGFADAILPPIRVRFGGSLVGCAGGVVACHPD